MRHDSIHHSTSDGWRGVIAESFTFCFVEKVAASIARFVLNTGGKQIFIGYDTRFLSLEFAKRAAHVFEHFKIKPLISLRPIPTPIVSFWINKKEMACGITITASHNPYYYNGIKVRMGYGGPPDKGFTDEIESLMSTPIDHSIIHNVAVSEDNPFEEYTSKVKSLVDINAFCNRPFKILVDTMHGATKGVLKNILLGTRCEVSEIHSDFDPYFGGVPPEPQMNNTTELQKMVSSGAFNIGVAHDGDGDRIIAAIPTLGYLSPHDTVVSLLWHLVKVRGEKGLIVGSVTLSRRVARLAELFGFEYREVPIGFRNACKIMRSERVIIAGEENGGVGFGFYLPERDGTLAAILLAEAELTYNNGVTGILKDVEEIAGGSGFSRLNLKLSIPPTRVIQVLEENPPDRLANSKVVKISTVDGIKFFLDTGDWVNVRAAGTEELLRIYAESSDNKDALRLAAAAEEMVRKIDNKS